MSDVRDIPNVQGTLSGWGNHPRQVARVYRPEKLTTLRQTLLDANVSSVISRGLGRSYGDAALNDGGGVVLHTRLDRMLAFDAQSGELEVEAGVSIGDIVDTFAPRGWFPLVVPGTRQVTVGGAIACNVHGKNHHRDGAFAAGVVEISLMLAGGELLRCSSLSDADVFHATLGGMGLTGAIVSARLRLRSIASTWMRVRRTAATSLDALLDAIDEPTSHAYSVAWIDALAAGGTLGRGVLLRGDHAQASEVPSPFTDRPFEQPRRRHLAVPRFTPALLLNRHLVALHNRRHFDRNRDGEHIEPLERFFFPLDALVNWNRLYGRRGFVQHQAVVPRDGGRAAVVKLLQCVASSGHRAYLAVLKAMGPADAGMLSFPMPGYTLALDLPARRGIAELLAQLDRITRDAGGRVYLAKDAMLDRAHLPQMYPRLEEFRTVRERVDPQRRFSSSLSRRLGIDRAVEASA